MEVTKPVKVGNVWTNLISGNTGESVNYEEVTEWYDGTPMDDPKVDGVIYRKLPASVGGGYVKRVFTDGVINVRWFGAVGDGITDDLVAINKALQFGGSIIIPKGDYLVNVSGGFASGGLVIRSDTSLVMEEGAKIILAPNDFSVAAIIGISGRTNVTIKGGEIIGDKLTHTGSGGERSHGIWIHNSSNVKIEGTTIRECWGDGIYLGGDNSSTQPNEGCTEVLIDNVVCDNNRRQGLSLVCGSNIRIVKSSFINTSGANPQDGIDIEPVSNQTVEGVEIDSCFFSGNVGSGVEMIALQEDAFIKDITISNSRFIDNRITAIATAEYLGVSGINLINNTISVSSRDSAIRVTNYTDNVNIVNCKVISTNDSLTSNGILVTGGATNVVVEGCYSNNFPTAGIRISSAGVNCTVRGCVTWGGANGIYASGSEWVTIIGSNCSNHTARGIWLSALVDSSVISNSIGAIGNNGIVATGCTNLIISNNTVANIGLANLGVYSGVVITGSTTNTNIYSNTFISNSQMRFGVSIDSPASGNFLGINNYVGSFTNGNYSLFSGNVMYPDVQLGQDGVLDLTSGPTVLLDKLGRSAKEDGDAIYPSPGMRPFLSTASAVNYPTSAGGGIFFQRQPSSAQGAFMLFKPNNNVDQLYFKRPTADGLMFHLNFFGGTSARPTSPVVGQIYFDTTLGHPVWYNGTAWVDATGTTV